jgi:membrane protein implicated in regulation of membrane protease activity
MEWLDNNIPLLLVVLGIAFLAIEVGVLGFSVFILFFLGLASIATGLLMVIGLLPQTLVAAFGGVAVLGLGFALALWKPLRNMQNSGARVEVKGDFIGYHFVLAGNCGPNDYSVHRMSGVDWNVRSEAPLAAGTEVEVIRVEVGLLTVRPRT